MFKLMTQLCDFTNWVYPVHQLTQISNKNILESTCRKCDCKCRTNTKLGAFSRSSVVAIVPEIIHGFAKYVYKNSF